MEECGQCPVFVSFTLAFALHLRKNYAKTSVRVRKTSVGVRKTSVISLVLNRNFLKTSTEIIMPLNLRLLMSYIYIYIYIYIWSTYS
jgi:hypothetical protein